MGKAQKKTGKGRIDKFYKLAKEQGYRARSAFKLIQLNKKYNFLESARCCIDLCAAPGGWLQVASKYMPPNSIIVGVDLVPIKPIPRVVTFAADITTTNCRNLIRGELKDWKADVVLHDGAPNVGTAWVQDAFSQSELVLMSLKLAVEFLMKGGTFVTKIFRSADYNNLMWVFNQLFAKVEATKPPASRNVSAEIFVVCREFHAPKTIDPKFLDPKHVFKELAPTDSIDKSSSANNVHANVFMPEKKRRKRDGYDDGDYTLHKTISATDFIHKPDAIGLLGTTNQIEFSKSEEKEWLKLDITGSEIQANCDDLKVLGKGDFKALIRWRSALREELGLDVKTKPAEELTETVAIVEGLDEEGQIQEELERLNNEASARAKRERRKNNEKKTRTIQRMQLQMTAPMDIGQELQDASLHGQSDIFDLKTAERRRKTLLTQAELSGSEDDDSEGGAFEGNDNDDDALDSEEEQEKKVGALEEDLDELYDAYKAQRSERDAKFKAKESRKNNKDREETWGGIREERYSDASDSGSSAGGWEEMQGRKGDNDESSDEEPSSSDGDSDEDRNTRKRKRAPEPPIGDETSNRKRQKLSNGLVTKLKEPKTAGTASKASQIWFSQDIFADLKHVDVEMEPHENSPPGRRPQQVEFSLKSGGDALMSILVQEREFEDEDDPGFGVVPLEMDEDGDAAMWDVDHADIDAQKREYIKNFGLNTAEAVTLAQQLVNREKTKTQLINDGFNRYSLNAKDGLPNWFLDDEAKHYKVNIPITKEAVMALRAKQRELDARPIKKVAEAKARKKMRAVQRLEKAMKKAEGVNQTSDMTEKEKASQIEKLMKRGLGKGGKKKSDVKLVVAKGPNRGLKGRPKGVKGRYRMVDSRGKKELRAQKRRDKERKPKRR